MIKFVLLSCLVAAALAMPHHTPSHQHDAAEAKPVAPAEVPAKPQESEKPAEAVKPEAAKPEAEAVKPEAAKPEAVKAEASSDGVRKEEHKETPVVPLEHAVEHHAADHHGAEHHAADHHAADHNAAAVKHHGAEHQTKKDHHAAEPKPVHS